MRGLLKRFVRNRRGNVALTFGLVALPLSAMVGMGVDVTNATRIRLALQDATDSAAIALARQAPTIADSQITAKAQEYIRASYNGTTSITVTNATIDRNTITATVDARASVPTFFSQLIGVSTIPVTSHAVAKGMLLEIAMVLDNSGSMTEWAGSQSKIDALKDASDEFLTVMFGTQTTSQRVKVSVVPFAAGVNVGTGNASASWMDTTGASSLHREDYSSTTKTRWQLFSDLDDASWAGCVLTRPSPYDVNDTAPSSGDTLFVPWFAPDEPDGDNGWRATGSFSNSYLDDEGGNCSGGNADRNTGDDVKQARTCKYRNEEPSGWGKGPNYLCDSRPIQPLTNSRSTLNTAITNMQAKGATNILEGMMWGWRTLSPTAPFTEGKSYTAPNNRKIIVLMTDGENNLSGKSNRNHSEYGSFGFAENGRVGTMSSNNAQLTAALDAKTATACANAKAQGILVYTIAFDLDVDAARTLLRNCASDPSYFFAPATSAELTPVFKKIAQSINSLRIAE